MQAQYMHIYVGVQDETCSELIKNTETTVIQNVDKCLDRLLSWQPSMVAEVDPTLICCLFPTHVCGEIKMFHQTLLRVVLFGKHKETVCAAGHLLLNLDQTGVVWTGHPSCLF